MKTRFSLLLIILSSFIVSGCNDNGNGGISQELTLLLDDIVKCTMLEKQLPGLSVTALKNGNVIYQKGFGKADIEGGVDVTPETRFALASMTKIFTTFGVMQLIEDGQAALDDPIGMHLPGLPNNEWKVRTIRDLLSMSSGIPELSFCTDGMTDESVCEDTTVDGEPVKFNVPCMNEGFECRGANRVPYIEYLDNAALIPLQFPGGAKYYYSNSNFIILGLLIEELSGMSYEEYLNEHVLGPIGMTHTRPNNVPPPVIPDLTLGYTHVTAEEEPDAPECITFDAPPTNCSSGPPEGVRCKLIPVDDLRLPAQSFSAGWLISTQPDLANLERVLHLRSPILLDVTSYEEMWTNRQFNDGSFDIFGLGWGVCSEKDDMACPVPLDPLAGGESMDKIMQDAADEEGKVVFKDGALEGTSTIIVRYLKDGITVIVFDNITGESEGELKFAPLDLAAEITKTIRDAEN